MASIFAGTTLTAPRIAVSREPACLSKRRRNTISIWRAHFSLGTRRSMLSVAAKRVSARSWSRLVTARKKRTPIQIGWRKIFAQLPISFWRKLVSKVVAIIPARWGSTRFPGKPLHLIAGKALLRHVWERCQKASSLETVIVATDDMRIAEAAFAWGAEVSLTNSGHHSGSDRIAEVAAKLDGISHIINVQGDEPLIDPKLIDQLAKRMQRDPKIE